MNSFDVLKCRSQSAGGYTHRYFILEDNELKYWKFIPKGVAQQSGIPMIVKHFVLFKSYCATTIRRESRKCRIHNNSTYFRSP